jgi:hypothetical protein
MQYSPSPFASSRSGPNDVMNTVPQLRRLVAGFPPRQPGFDLGTGYEEVMVGNMGFSEKFGFPCQFSFHQLFYIH